MSRDRERRPPSRVRIVDGPGRIDAPGFSAPFVSAEVHCDACHKRAWPSEHEAKKGAMSVARRQGESRHRTYRCPVNRGYWHLAARGRLS